MRKIVLSVHEFMTIMGGLDEELKAGGAEGRAVFEAWLDQWKSLESKTRDLPPMEYADLLFDGKVTINAISDEQLADVIGFVDRLIAMHQGLIDEDDLDADPEELESWQKRRRELNDLRAVQPS
ncbi:MAG: hypothetical protein H6907_09100 [Hyphomicrobiales bacterium]|nr:hypothetical protein [Hyphomicrobiales bacterium]MCP5371875.1 hypothetical protein [Hyphomicrobiales bacterium]